MMPSLISSRTGVSGPRPSATPRTAMSRSVMMPITLSPSQTGIEPASARSMKPAASRAVWSALTVCTSVVMTSLIFFTEPSSFANSTNGAGGAFLRQGMFSVSRS